jgi:hypothetical protein
MLLDNLFTMLGVPGTAILVLGIVVFLGVQPTLAILRAASCKVPRLARTGGSISM